MERVYQCLLLHYLVLDITRVRSNHEQVCSRTIPTNCGKCIPGLSNGLDCLSLFNRRLKHNVSLNVHSSSFWRCLLGLQRQPPKSHYSTWPQRLGQRQIAVQIRIFHWNAVWSKLCDCAQLLLVQGARVRADADVKLIHWNHGKYDKPLYHQVNNERELGQPQSSATWN